MTEDMFGRGSELAQFDRILEQRQPTFVAVTGQAGMGKTSLLKEFQARAAGWKTVPSTAEEELSVDASTTENSFFSLLRTLSGSAAGESSVETAHAQARAAAADWGSSIQTAPARNSLHPCVEQLRSWAPVLLLIDGYRPDPRFASWFADPFIKDVKRAEAPIVVVVAERPDYATKVSSFADEIVFLSPLDIDMLRQHFQSIGKQIIPPIEPDELDQYAAASYSQPEMFNSLTRVLQLAPPSDARDSLQPGKDDS